MKQAKVLTVAERKRLLTVIANDRHSERNRLAVMLSFLARLRVGEVATLKVSDVVDGEGRPGAAQAAEISNAQRPRPSAAQATSRAVSDHWAPMLRPTQSRAPGNQPAHM